jgi:hypothetical protein
VENARVVCFARGRAPAQYCRALIAEGTALNGFAGAITRPEFGGGPKVVSLREGYGGHEDDRRKSDASCKTLQERSPVPLRALVA